MIVSRCRFLASPGCRLPLLYPPWLKVEPPTLTPVIQLPAVAMGLVAPVSTHHQLDYCPTPLLPPVSKPSTRLAVCGGHCWIVTVYCCCFRTAHCCRFKSSCYRSKRYLRPHWLPLPFPRCLLSSFSEQSTVIISEVSAVAVSKLSTVAVTIPYRPLSPLPLLLPLSFLNPPPSLHSQSIPRSNSRSHFGS